MDYNKHTTQLDRARLSKTSYMNNTKWYEFFHLICTNKVNVQELRIKFLTTDKIYLYRVPTLDGIDKSGFLDGGHPGPFNYKEIEYLEISTQIIVERKNREETLAPTIILQDTEMISELCNDIGHLLIEYSEGEKIKVFGYM